jgi:PAS domain S-box-containing protein
MNTNIHKNSALILIADDDRFTRMLLRQIMQEEGHRVHEVEDGEQCLAAYTQLHPDMVLLDAMMPVMDGFKCCHQLHAGVKPSDRIPVLMITGLNDQASVDWAFEAGATDFVTKPIHPPVLRRRVRRLLEASWAEKALRESEKKYRSVVENVKEVIFQTNADGDWTFLNPAWTTLTGFTVEESLGTSFFNYVHSDDLLMSKELWQSLIQGGNESCRHEIRFLTKASEIFWVEIHAHSTLVTDGAVTGLSGILQDITKRREAEALEKEKIKLESEIIERQRTEKIIRHTLEKEQEIGEFKSRIITTISHEFRTPLTTILGSAELLRNYGHKWTEEKKKTHFQRIEASVEHITKMLNDVVLIGQAEAGQLQFNPMPMNLETVVQRIFAELQQSFENQKEGYQNAIPALVLSSNNSDVVVNLDENLIRQIWTNLVSNAVKYSPKGGIVHCSLTCQDNHAIFQIRDEGIGIPLEDRERIFETFYRASNAGTIQGTGLGLAITKKCIDLLQGQIALLSEVGIGTTFIVTLPIN